MLIVTFGVLLAVAVLVGLGVMVISRVVVPVGWLVGVMDKLALHGFTPANPRL